MKNNNLHLSDLIRYVGKKAAGAAKAAVLAGGLLLPSHAQESKESVPPQRASVTESRTQFRDILNFNGVYASGSESDKQAGGNITNKLIVDFGETNLNIYANGFNQTQKFDDYTIDGNGGRAWATLGHYFNSGDTVLFAEAGAGVESRNYGVDFDSGNQLGFGDRSAFGTVKAGAASNNSTGQFDNDENYGVANKRNLLLVQATKNSGKATGDVEDMGYGSNYDALRLKANCQVLLTNDLAAKVDASYFSEEFGDGFLKQRTSAADAGLRYFTNIGGNPAYIDALAVVQRESKTRAGLGVGFGLRVMPGVDWTTNAAFLSGDEKEVQATTGLTVYLGK